MKLKLIDVVEKKSVPSFDNETTFHFKDAGANRLTASVHAEHPNAKRWYELVCSFVAAQKSGQRIYIDIAGEFPDNVIPPEMDFLIELEDKMFRSLSSRPTDPNERERRDING